MLFSSYWVYLSNVCCRRHVTALTFLLRRPDPVVWTREVGVAGWEQVAFPSPFLRCNCSVAPARRTDWSVLRVGHVCYSEIRKPGPAETKLLCVQLFRTICIFACACDNYLSLVPLFWGGGLRAHPACVCFGPRHGALLFDAVGWHWASSSAQVAGALVPGTPLFFCGPSLIV